MTFLAAVYLSQNHATVEIVLEDFNVHILNCYEKVYNESTRKAAEIRTIAYLIA